MREWYRFELSFKNANLNLLFKSRKLFQQYIVDKWVGIESNNMNYIRFNQVALRQEMYAGLMDHLNHRAEREDLQVGRMFILPATHQVK
jgi:hypothetical protein